MVVDACDHGRTVAQDYSGRNASLGKPAAYQASLHRFGVGVESVRPLE